MKRKPDERDFISGLRGAVARPGSPLRLGIGDDAAIFKPAPGCETLGTSDLLVEGVHFDLKTTAPWELGAKAVAASLSDIAAMGGLPRLFLVSLVIPKRRLLNPPFFKALYDGMRAWGDAFGAELAGGDTSSGNGPLVIDIFMLGEAEKGRALLRSGARPGDDVFVTNTLGDSAAGLAALQNPRLIRGDLKSSAALAVKRHKLPVPQVLAGRFLLSKRIASACIDISDGLASEAWHLADESKVAIELEAGAIPISRTSNALAVAMKKSALQWALSGGEDYQLLFTAPPSKRAVLARDLGRFCSAEISLVGRVKKGRGVTLRHGGMTRPLKNTGYAHAIFS